MRRWLYVTMIGLGALAWGEWLNHRWSRMLVSEPQGGALAIMVPGMANPQRSANRINRWRVRIALRSTHGDEPGVIIFSGGAVRGIRTEAELLAEYARNELGFAGEFIVETQSRSTWDNVTNVLPLIPDADRIVIASQPAHALKIRAYIRRQRPDLAERLSRGADYRFGEWLPAKPLLAVYGLWTLRALRSDERQLQRRPKVSRSLRRP